MPDGSEFHTAGAATEIPKLGAVRLVPLRTSEQSSLCPSIFSSVSNFFDHSRYANDASDLLACIAVAW